MQFMLLMIPKGYETAKPGTVPTDVARVKEMMKFTQALKDAGVLVSALGERTIRLVTHLDVSRAQAEEAAAVLATALASTRPSAGGS